jgi:hypothetical protein
MHDIRLDNIAGIIVLLMATIAMWAMSTYPDTKLWLPKDISTTLPLQICKTIKCDHS